MVVVGRLVGTFEPARVMVEIAHATSASARANTIVPSQPVGTAAGKNGNGMSHLSASPASTASVHAIGGRTMTFAVSAVSAMAGPVNLRSFRCGPATGRTRRQRCIGPIIGQQCRQSASGGSIFGSYGFQRSFATLSGRTRQNIMAQNLAREDSAMVPSCVFAGVGGYYASKQSGLVGVFRRAADGSDWKHALSEIEAFTVFVHPHDPHLVFAGTADGVYRSTDRGQNFGRADFPDRGVQVWSFLQDDADPKWMLAGGSPVSIYRSKDGGASWKRMPDPKLPIHAKMPFSCRVMRFAPHSRRRGEIFAVLEVSGVMRSTDGGESWSDCSADLLRLAEAEPRLRSKLVSDTEAEGMLDGHAVCTSSADPDSIIIAVRMGLFRSKDQGKTWQDMRVDRFSPFTYGRDIKVSPQDPNTLYACLSVAASSK